jgi:3-deoxy-D-manno-octulosonate 8-phosphate phosphatase (KDO 8-P phosphatase)
MPLDDTALRAAAGRIRLLVLDVDGVMTDGRLHYDADGREFKSFHVRDGFGIVRALKSGLQVAVISGRASGSAAGRMRELKIPHVFLGCDDKLAAFDGLLRELGLSPEQAACVGDDVPDLPIMARAGLAIAVADAHPEVLAVAHWRTRLPGGRGAVREVCDLLRDAQGAGPAGG